MCLKFSHNHPNSNLFISYSELFSAITPVIAKSLIQRTTITPVIAKNLIQPTLTIFSLSCCPAFVSTPRNPTDVCKNTFFFYYTRSLQILFFLINSFYNGKAHLFQKWTKYHLVRFAWILIIVHILENIFEDKVFIFH